ncbi:MAG TPA: 16S rRNA (adenine(1518)-N(6)/adenine(1519)-N(6))-dimethyltransferase RsmA [Thermomicrobiales bacterium]|nr:16S rRNA (adenine(1518)-N(6)/adenine(1519)-N(6))-dimethyltransferase RsmA [Thermomicrobiales bacterium]
MASSSAEREPGWRARLRELGLTPSKALGQNFLHDQGIVRRIAESAEIGPDETVLEVGPGLGILTEELAARAKRVVAVELDDRLAAYLPTVLPPNVEVVHADALEIDPAALAGPDYRVVANLPYSIGNAILRRMLEALPPPRTLTVMVQREVAERIAASPPEMSLLAVGVQFYGTPKILFRIGGGAFIPPPRVESAVLHITTQPPLLPASEHPAFFRVVQSGFAQRRKQLGNTLSTGLFIERVAVVDGLTRAGIAPTERAERLTVADWVRVYHAFRNAGWLRDDQ